ncbi:hypothetical protein JD844_010611 [Phrynosoma platyrhinos]|uniref:Uncharacterized protein n=1 Tax=Phrynosoma platyrhinos TaxID=52577 RepID=A0ABQ7THA3_PHRPL|nr:hypothetical protein JD844_010611 [Phrynosoma platyrhinos]
MEENNPDPWDFALKMEEILSLVKQMQNVGNLEPRIEDLVKRINKLQQETRKVMQLHCEETEAKMQRQQKLNLECKQRIEAVTAKIQAEKLKQSEQRSLALLQEHQVVLDSESEGEIREDTPVLVPQEPSITHRDCGILGTEADNSEQEAEADRVLKAHPDLVYDTVTCRYLMPIDPDSLPPYEGSLRWVQTQSREKPVADMKESKERLLREEKLLQEKLASIQEELDFLTQSTLSEERKFLKSQEAAAALELFEEENKKAKEYLEIASKCNLSLQQKCSRLKAELEDMEMDSVSTEES